MAETGSFTPLLGASFLSPFYDAAIGLATREGRWRSRLVAQVNPNPDDRILDMVGSGLVASACADQVGIDAFMADLAARVTSKATQVASLSASDPDDASGDGIVDEDDLSFEVDGAVLPLRNTSGVQLWRWDPLRKAVIFRRGVAPLATSTVTLHASQCN